MTPTYNQTVYGDYKAPAARSGNLASIARLVRSYDPVRLLDAGCSAGDMTRALRYRCPGSKIIAIDIAECGDKVRQTVDAFYRVELGVQPIPVRDGYFDTVHCSEVLEHVFYTENMLRELARVTCKDGYLILTTPNLASWCNRLFVLLGLQPFLTDTGVEESDNGNYLTRASVPPGHIRSFTMRSLVCLLERTGWEIVERRGQGMLSNRWGRWDSWVSRWWPAMASDLVVVGRKK